MKPQIIQSSSLPKTAAHILLAEDEPDNLSMLSETLRGAGYRITAVANGAAAWNELQQRNDFALIVTDRSMPEMDGLTLALRIKDTKNLRHIPIIMQTGATAKKEVKEGIKAGVFYYLTKPYDEETLLTIVKSALYQSSRAEAFENRFRRQREGLGTLIKAEFHLQTPEEAENVAFVVGMAFPRPELAVTGLYELLLNAIEHGNLGLGYQAKDKLMATGQWEEELQRRLVQPDNAAKKVILQVVQNDNKIEVVITDGGPGFDWTPFLEIEPSRASHAAGRGIAKANLLSFDRLEYMGQGNQVRVTSVLS